MFTPWIKRSSLKRSTRSKRLVVEGERPSLIMLLSLTGLLVGVGVFVVQRSWALQEEYATPTPVPQVSQSYSPTPTPTPTPAARR